MSSKIKSVKKIPEMTIEDRYKKRDLYTHVILEPGMFIGSVTSDTVDMWVYDSENENMIKKEITYVAGLYKIYDEIIVNARDHTVREGLKKNTEIIKVNIDETTGKISVWNDGDGVPIEIHKKEGIYVPELIFGNLLAGENYDKEGKLVGGQNGLGAKLANIFSTEFVVETSDGKKKYTQQFDKNMTIVGKPEIQNNYKGKPYTMISFLPDYKRFGLKGLTNDIVSLFKRRVYDLAGCTGKNVSVYLNDKLLKIKTFEDYVKMFHKPKEIIYENVSDRWQVGTVFDTDSDASNISFTNGIWTSQGGTHVNHILDQICKKLLPIIKAKYKDVNVKSSHIRENVRLYVNAAIVDPKFNSQNKEILTKKVSEFGSKCELSDSFIIELSKTGIVDAVAKIAQAKDTSSLSKSDGKKVKKLYGMDKLDDAEEAGGRNGKHCRLFLTEGDSAKAFVISGLSVIGRKYYGAFPLRGKVLNVRDASAKKVGDNIEFDNIKKIMGLKQNKKYDTIDTLRYGGIIIMTDQDSVTGDTPLLLKSSDNLYEIKTIDQLSDSWIIGENGKEYATTKYNIWTEKGWTQIISVMRHKVDKKMYRVLTDVGVVDVTEDHSLIKKDGTEIAPRECVIGTELLHSFPNLTDNVISVTQKEAYNMGVFHSKDGSKNIPKEILNGSRKVREQFFKGYCEGYGKKTCVKSFDIESKTTAHGIYFLCKSLGYSVSINVNEYESSVNTLTVRENSLHSSQNKIKKIIDLGKTEQYVYDLETENHHFQAGIGEMIVHNTDGHHIKGLLINMFQTFWPSLLKIKGFIQCLSTPIVKVFKKNGSDRKEFFSLLDYKNWAEETGADMKNWETKYYKGLGTSTDEEAKESFVDFEQKIINYIWETANGKDSQKSKDSQKDEKSVKEKTESDNESDNETDEEDVKSKQSDGCDDMDDINSESYRTLDLAFSKNKTFERKIWVNDHRKDNEQHQYTGDIPISDFINHDLKAYSRYNIERAIPKIDGLKPSQRKTIFGAIKKNILKKEIKVNQLASYISEKTDYHHGEQSLYDTIINMAQDFVGSNNVNMLIPNGNFGYRKEGGAESAAPRYIFTQLNQLTPYLFKKDDEKILTYNYSDNLRIEPEIYAPILPVGLFNGMEGIGTAYSTNVPAFNPREIANNILKLIDGENTVKMVPWYRGFTGKITRVSEGKYVTTGICEVINNCTVRITELPVGVWTDAYKKGLYDLCNVERKEKKDEKKSKVKKMRVRKDQGKFIEDIIDNSDNIKVDMTIVFEGDSLKTLIKADGLEKYLRLSSSLSLTNMCIISENGSVIKYDTVDDILTEFYLFRLKMYEKRKAYMCRSLKNEVDIINWKIQFVEHKLDGTLVLERKKKADVHKKLEQLGYPKLAKNIDDIIEDETGVSDDDGDDSDNEDAEIVKNKKNVKSYEYTDMSIYNLTVEKLEKMKQEKRDKEKEHADYIATSIRDIWRREINEFIIQYDKWVELYTKKQQGKAKTKGAKSNTKPKPKPNTKAKAKN